MILLKSFFRKKKTKIFLIIFVVLFSAFLIIQNLRVYYSRLKELSVYNHTSLFMIAKKDQSETIKNDKEVKNYFQAILFERGEDGEIFTTQSVISEDFSYENPESNIKLTWDSLEFSNNHIIVLPSSTIAEDLHTNEVIIKTNDASFKEDAVKKAQNKEVVFKYNNKDVILKIKDITEIDEELYPALYISDNLFAELMEDSTTYFYIIKAQNSIAYDNLTWKWEKLENNDEYKIIQTYNYYKENESAQYYQYSDLLDMLEIVSFMATIIVIIIIIFSIKDILIEEEKTNDLQRKIGFSISLNIKIAFLKMVLLNTIAILMSIPISTLITFSINHIWKIKLTFVEIQSIIILLVTILISNILLIILNNRKKIKKHKY